MACNCKNELSVVKSEPYAQRLGLCANCDALKRLHGGLPKGADVGLLDRCGECGCLVKVKAALGSQHCPRNLW